MIKKLGIILLICGLMIALMACNEPADIIDNAPTDELLPTENQDLNQPRPIGDEVEFAYTTYAAIMDRIALQPRGAVDFNLMMRLDAIFGDYISSNTTYGNLRMIVDGSDIWLATIIDFGEFGGVHRKYLAMENFYITFIRIDTPDEELFEFNLFIDGEDYEAMAYFRYEEDLVPQLMMFNFPILYREDFISAEVEEVNGFTVTNVLLDNHAFIAFVIEHEFLEPVLDGIIVNDDDDDINMELGDFMMIIVTDNDDIPVAISLLMTMELEVQGDPARLDIAIDSIFNAFDHDVVINI
jgi:hypothetical protein